MTVHPLYARIWVRASVLAPTPDWPVPTRVQAVFANGVLTVHHDADEQAQVAKQHLALVTANPERLVAYNQALEQACTNLEQTMHLLPQEGLPSASNADLWSYFERHEQAHHLCLQWGWTSVFADYAQESFTRAIRDLIRDRVPQGVDVGRVFSVLMLSEKPSIGEQDQEAFLRLANGREHDWEQRVQALNAKTCFVGMLEGEPIKSYAQTVEDIQRVSQHIPDIEKHLQNTTTQRARDVAEREQWMGSLGFTTNEVVFINAYRDALWLKGYRRRVQQYALYRLEPILDDIARRLGIETTPLMYLSPAEIRAALLWAKPVPEDVHTRVRYCRYVADESTHRFELDGEPVVADEQETLSLAPTQLRGMTASRGYATGMTYVVTDDADMAGMPDKAILIIKQARPEYIELFARAAAVVCEQGGVTSHAAIIAREYGVPCIVATKRATQCFPTGTRVEVDADRAEIRLLC